MKSQLIITLGREFGSGGHEAGQKLADIYGIKFLDHSLLQTISEEKSVDLGLLRKYDEKPRNKLLSRTVSGFSNALEDQVARFQFDYISQIANEGESFVVIGRCAEHILQGHPAMISVFVLGNTEEKCKRIMEKYNLNNDEALHLMKRKDATRKNYHNYYCGSKWGDSRNYDLCVNSSKIGVSGVVELVELMVEKRGLL